LRDGAQGGGRAWDSSREPTSVAMVVDVCRGVPKAVGVSVCLSSMKEEVDVY